MRNEILSDFWFYSFKCERWQELSKENDPENDPPPAGYGLNLYYTKIETKGDVLTLTGGKDELGIYFYMMKQKNWKFIQIKNGIDILSLYGHSVIPINNKPGSSLIKGGKNSDGDFNNFSFLVSNNGESVFPHSTSRISPINRFQRKCVVVNDVVFCIGGESIDNDFDETVPFALKLNSLMFTVSKIEGER